MTERAEREPAWAGEREPACRSLTKEKETQGLTNPSSATEAGEVKREGPRQPHRQPLFAGARG